MHLARTRPMLRTLRLVVHRLHAGGARARPRGLSACTPVRPRAGPHASLSAVPPSPHTHRRRYVAATAGASADTDADTAEAAARPFELNCEHFERCPGCALATRLDFPPVLEEGRRFFAAHQLPHFNLHTGACAATPKPSSRSSGSPLRVSFQQRLGEQQSVATPHAARVWAHPSCRPLKIQSCCCLGSAFEAAAFQTQWLPFNTPSGTGSHQS
jgi:hypothetical protein